MGWGSSREGVGDQKVRYVLRNPGKSNFLAGYPEVFAGISRGRPKSLRKNVQSSSPTIGAQPVLESYDVFCFFFGDSLWTFHRECPKTHVIIVKQERKRGGRNWKTKTPPKQSYSNIFGRHRSDE